MCKEYEMPRDRWTPDQGTLARSKSMGAGDFKFLMCFFRQLEYIFEFDYQHLRGETGPDIACFLDVLYL